MLGKWLKGILFIVLLFNNTLISAEDGYRLWLRFDPVEDEDNRLSYLNQIQQIYIEGDHPIIQTAMDEMVNGIQGLLGTEIPPVLKLNKKSGIIGGIIGQSRIVDSLLPKKISQSIRADGYCIYSTRYQSKEQILIAATDEKGLLYGTFHLLRMIQNGKPLEDLKVIENPKVKHRLLNHWDNLDRTVERGYAGFSIWNWHELPEFISPQYIDYARANASIGINGSVVTNVNANALIFREDYLEKVAALADVFRNYGIKIYLTARFSAPMELGNLKTSDPLDKEVQKWWNDKVKQIYSRIPDFGGFLVKANSEGQPGPQDYNRNHADGANMLADALNPFGGIVMWRAFVYSESEPEDRAKQAFDEFVPLDGKFRKNVMIQVKNGPIDFQPREPVNALFGAMPKTSLMMEFQITKEYLGQGTHLVGLANMYKEVLQTDTYSKGKGSIVARVIDGSLDGHELSGMAGVSNIGTSRNWTGNLFGQADWYAFGRLSWNPDLSSETIYLEWINMTFSNDKYVVESILSLLQNSYESCVKYMTPLGLHHIMAAGHHYGPGPWVDQMSRADWTSVYYHKADEKGIGFDRTSSGSDALSQYHPEFRKEYEDLSSCPEKLLLWFHHVPWDHKMHSGKTLWEELCRQYHHGADEVLKMKAQWNRIEGFIDADRFHHVNMHLEIQEKEARWWRDACLTYFQSFSKMEIPADLEQPEKDLDYYKSIIYPYSPGIRPRW